MLDVELDGVAALACQLGVGHACDVVGARSRRQSVLRGIEAVRTIHPIGMAALARAARRGAVPVADHAPRAGLATQNRAGVAVSLRETVSLSRRMAAGRVARLPRYRHVAGVDLGMHGLRRTGGMAATLRAGLVPRRGERALRRRMACNARARVQRGEYRRRVALGALVRAVAHGIDGDRRRGDR